MLDSKVLPLILSAQSFNFDQSLPRWCFCTDSRQIEPNSWFIAFKGINFNGHNFLQTAGAKGLIVSEKPSENLEVPVLLVPDTLKAYQQIANYQRKTLKPLVIGITGSNGKTTTKEILAKVLSEKYKVLATSANENNEIGVPKTILKANEQTEIIIVECGMRGLGQIAELTLIAEPDYAIITNIGTAHIGLLGSREAIAQAKAEIFINLANNKTALIPINEPLLEIWKNKALSKTKFIQFGNFENAQFKPPNTHFIYHGQNFYLQTSNLALISNACAVIDLAFELGLNKTQIQNGLNKFLPEAGRGQIKQLASGAYLIDETYNGNPDSVLALAYSMHKLSETKKKVLVLGAMAELGDLEEKLLSQLASQIKDLIDQFVFVGAQNEKLYKALKTKSVLFEAKEEALEFLKPYLNSEEYILGFKASRSAKLEELVQKIQDSFSETEQTS